ncbi:MAG: hypothetical protein RBJ76_08510 [Stenomitos frigidus ULC029]
MSNAVKFTPEGGTITISSRLAFGLELEQTTLPPVSTDSTALSVELDARFLVLEVTDTLKL